MDTLRTPEYTVNTWTEMEKAYKIAQAKLQVWNISTQNMCKRCPKIVQNLKKCPKLHKNGQKPLIKPKVSTAVRN